MKHTYPCFIKILSPLHIGCDEVYEPTGFLVDENKNELTSFDPITYISLMNENDKNRFSAICLKGTVGSILEIYKFLRRRSGDGKRVQLCSGFIGHYSKTLSMSIHDKRKVQQELGSFAISRTSFLSGCERPYIPGSSIKGALRTAYLNQIERKESIPTPKGRDAAGDLEKKLLSYSSIESDPFRLVKVSDFMPVGDAPTRIVYAVNVKKNTGISGRGPFQIVETIVPGTVFRGQITVEKPLSDSPVQKPVKLEALLQGSKVFYTTENSRENGELNKAGVSMPNEYFSKENVPLRIGRHSGAESMTIDGHRNIKIMAKKKENSRFDDHATTLWVASEEAKPRSITHCRPFGWVELCDITSSCDYEFERMENEWKERKSNAKVTTTTMDNGAQHDNPNTVSSSLSPALKASDSETWEKVLLVYAPGSGTISTRFEGKNAGTKDQSIIPKLLMNRLKKKKNAGPVSIKVNLIGGKEYRLVEICD